MQVGQHRGVNQPASWLPTTHLDLIVFILARSNVIAIRSTSTVVVLVPCLFLSLNHVFWSIRTESIQRKRVRSWIHGKDDTSLLEFYCTGRSFASLVASHTAQGCCSLFTWFIQLYVVRSLSLELAKEEAT